MEGHVHSATCGCKEYVGAENADDLFSSIHLQAVKCLNQTKYGAGAKVFKPYQQRFDKTNCVSSDSDHELLFIVPFTAQVKVKSICVIAKAQSNFPTKMKLYINEPNATFTIVQEQTPTQQFVLNANLQGLLHNAVKQTKFNKVNSLQIYLSGPERIDVAYIQIKGENTGLKRQIVKATYEIVPNAKKNEMPSENTGNIQMH